ncbi:MDR family MFS transporter [Empedobacter brevis]|uniref:MDR family MFS transporter n=1 Tax=Empedobacter brevis TaxID=247 RepID=UPI0039AFEB4C
MKKILKIYIDAYSGLSKESWMLAIVMLLNRMGSMVLPFLGIYMISKLGFSLENAGIVLSCFGVGSVIGSWFGGWITDKIGNFKVQALSLFLSAPLFFILPYFKTVESFAVIMLILSTISELFRPANSVAITRYAKKENITRAFSLNRMAVNLGFSIGPSMGGFLSNYSYDLLFYCNAGAALIAGIVFVAFFKGRKERNAATENVSEKVVEEKERNAYTDTPFLLFNLFCVLFSIAFFQILNTLPLFYKDVVHLSQKEIGFLMGFSGFLIVVFEMLLIHYTEKRFSVTQLLVFGSFITAISYFIFTFSHTLGMLYLAIGLMSIGEMLVLPLMSTVTAFRSQKNNRGAYMGLNGMSVAIAFIVSPYLGTHVAKDYGFDTLWIITTIILIIVAIGYHFFTKPLLPKNV